MIMTIPSLFHGWFPEMGYIFHGISSKCSWDFHIFHEINHPTIQLGHLHDYGPPPPPPRPRTQDPSAKATSLRAVHTAAGRLDTMWRDEEVPWSGDVRWSTVPFWCSFHLGFYGDIWWSKGKRVGRTMALWCYFAKCYWSLSKFQWEYMGENIVQDSPRFGWKNYN